VTLDALSPRSAEKQGPPQWAWAAGALAAIVIIVGAWTFLTQLKTASIHRPTIAVLPFANVSGYPRLGYFSDGMSEGVISMLARFPDLSVVGRSSSFFYKGKGADARQIGKDLGVDYVLEGFVNKEADWVSITARLIDAKTGELVWPNRLEKWGADPLMVQDQVTNRILDTLAGETGKRGQALYRLAWGKDTANLEEYDYYLRGHDLMGTDKDTNEKAREVLREGLTKFPDSRLLQLELGWYHWERAINRRSDSPSEDYKEAGELARKAFSRPNLTPLERRLGHWLLAFVNTQERNFDEALKEADLAMGLAPYDAEMMGDLSKVLVVAGRPKQAIEWADSAIAGDLGNKAKYLYNKGWALTVTGDDKKAIETLKGAAQWTGTPGLLAINYMRVNQPEEAKAELKKMLAMDPTFNLGKWRDLFTYRDPEVLNREVADLAKAGLPEE
jgi:adenylate cyclase